ncbi:MAG TPA: CHASE4 domain-containing protein, partial [Thermodesulfobacteriota bacterium]|nr:CHASE4 domain-containing protein [Thermodesulfobacteriota bacterium]
MEEKNTKDHVQLTLRLLSRAIDVMDSKAGDWANWDDAYAFVENGNPEFIKTNLTDKTFSELRINMMLFVHSTGRIVYRRAIDLEAEKEIPVPKDLFKHISAPSLLLTHHDLPGKHTGMILLSEGPLLVVSRPILTSRGKGPARGTLIFGRFLDAGEIQNVAVAAHFPLTLNRFDTDDLPSDFRLAKASFSEKTPIIARPMNRKTISGYTILKDIYGKPALILRADIERDIYQHGQDTIFSLIIVISFAGILLGLLTMVMLEKQVLTRLSFFSKKVSSISTSKDLSVRIPIAGKDELALLAEDINRMFERLIQSDRSLRESEEKFAAITTSAKDAIILIDNKGIISFWN